MRRALTGFGSMLLLVGLGTAISAAPDVPHGKVLAERWCAQCHLVSAGQRQASADAPPFASVAKRPDLSASQLAFFLLAPHPPMPSMSLSRTEATDLAAYIATLK